MKMTHDEMIEVIKAHRDGKAIESCRTDGNHWYLAPKPCWDFQSYLYRARPTPKLRPWTPAEGVGKVVRHKSNGNLIQISGYSKSRDEFVSVSNIEPFFSASSPHRLLMTCEQLDGQPCGVME